MYLVVFHLNNFKIEKLLSFIPHKDDIINVGDYRYHVNCVEVFVSESQPIKEVHGSLIMTVQEPYDIVHVYTKDTTTIPNKNTWVREDHKQDG